MNSLFVMSDLGGNNCSFLKFWLMHGCMGLILISEAWVVFINMTSDDIGVHKKLQRDKG